jgi:hypothetical protein
MSRTWTKWGGENSENFRKRRKLPKTPIYKTQKQFEDGKT